MTRVPRGLRHGRQRRPATFPELAAQVPGAVGLDPRFALAWNALDEADASSTAAFLARSHHLSLKSDGSPVTDVDVAIESALAASISRQFPHDVILGEELGGVPDASHLWIVDPIDGTSNFAEGIPIYAHLICYQESGYPSFALVSAPMLGKRWWAYRGAGSYESSERIRVSTTAVIGDAHISYGGLRDYREYTDGFVRLITACRRARGFGNFLPHMLVAEGTYDLASSGAGCKPWDVAPLHLIVHEAGGLLTGFDGSGCAADGPILTSNQRLHQDALAVVNGRTP
jgi:histidinol-phosphatase